MMLPDDELGKGNANCLKNLREKLREKFDEFF
jgi:hypothetical protein